MWIFIVPMLATVWLNIYSMYILVPKPGIWRIYDGYIRGDEECDRACRDRAMFVGSRRTNDCQCRIRQERKE